jgi:hypothetical protein
MLVEDSKGDRINFDRPIPVFEGTSTKRDRFHFVGWWYVPASSLLTYD